MSELLESLSSIFDAEALSRTAKALDADPSAVSKAVGALGPMLLGGMVKLSSAPEGATALLKMLPQGGDSLFGNFGNMLSGLLGGGSRTRTGDSVVNQLLGSGSNAMAASLSRSLGFNVAPLLGVVVPALLGAVSNVMKKQNVDAGGLVSLLSREHKTIAADPSNAATMALADAATDAGDNAAVAIAAYGADWTSVSLAPVAATMLVAGSDLSGPLGAMKEVKAAGVVLLAASKAAAPASVISAAFGGGLSADMVGKLQELSPTRGRLMDTIVAGERAVAANSPGDVVAYTDTILKTAQATAEAAKDGGFLGIGGTLVSVDEQVALDAIKTALS
jgi:hypothetical protein